MVFLILQPIKLIDNSECRGLMSGTQRTVYQPIFQETIETLLLRRRRLGVGRLPLVLALRRAWRRRHDDHKPSRYKQDHTGLTRVILMEASDDVES